MGRSKFPGKPSKSINRKRISVLQLDPNNTLTAAAATATATASTASTANSNNTATAANTNAVATAANTEDDEEQTKTEENLNYDSAEVEKRKNGKKEDDDDDHDKGGGGLAGAGVGGGDRRMNGRAYLTTTTNQQQQQQQQQNNNTNSQQYQQQNDKTENVTNVKKSNCSVAKDLVSERSKIPNKITTPATIATTITLTKELKKFHNISTACPTSSSSSCSALSSTSLHVNFSKRPCKKFKNLNINKPEVMLPSSSKLKLQQQEQQQQQQQQKETINSATLSASLVPLVNFTTASSSSATSNKTTPQQKQQQNDQPINNESLPSTSSASTLSSASLIATAAAASAHHKTSSSFSSSSSFNNNEYHKSVNHNNSNIIHHHTINDQKQQHCNNNNNDHDDDDDINHHNNDDHKRHINNNNDDKDDIDENSSLTFSTASSQLETTTKSKIQKSTTDNPTLLNGTSDLQKEDSSDSTQKTDSKNMIKQNPSTTPPNSPSRTMDHKTNVALSSSPSTASPTTSLNFLTAAANSVASANLNSNSNSSSSSGSDKKQKKTVTFKNVLETSDDKSAVKKFYNPDNRKPLVSIIKKECLNRPLMYTRNSDCIVRPSRLTEILKNNSNIDKLNSLKFRSSHSSSSATLPAAAAATTEGDSVLAGPLSRVFGAPTEEEDNKQKHSIINFRLSKEQSDDEDDQQANENDDDDDEEEEEEEEEQEEQQEDDGEQIEDKKREEITKFRNDQVKSEEVEQEIKLKMKADSENEEEEQQMIVDKYFVLPKRSRSSRVIKPNKRLIEDGIICKKSILKSATTLTQNSSSSANLKEDKMAVTTQQPNYFGLGDYNAKECNDTTSLKSTKDLGLDCAKLSSTFPSNTNVFSNFACNTNTVVNSSINSSSIKPSSFVLRQPRLQFESLSTSTTTSTATERNNNSNVVVAAAAAALALSASLPKSLQQAISSSATSAGSLSSSSSLLSPTFSLNGTSVIKTNNNSTLNSPTSSSSAANQCSVCSSMIHSKNLPQANKYVEPSCEHCRKFISKIAKKSLAMKNSPTMKNIQLQCKADGNCVILPLNNKAGHLKNFKKVYKERCGYCWLKKCLQTLQLPKVRLNAVLPVLNNASSSNAVNKSSLQDTKTKKELTEEVAQIKWKSLVDPITVTAAATTTSLTETLKLNLKTNPLVENNVTFGSVPLLRPAILEKPLFLKNSLETKQEKVDKKPLDFLKDFKTEKIEPIAVDTTTQALKSNNKKKDKTLERERKEIRIKEMLSPKTENEKTKEIKEKLKNFVNDLRGATNEDSSLYTATAAGVATSLCSPTLTGTTSCATATISTATSNGALNASAADKRQRIDLKGPRVKHVCRSASIVLGQPLAMFGEDGEETGLTEEQLQQTLQQTVTKLNITDENDNCASCKPQQFPNEDNSNILEPPPKAAKIEKLENTTKALVPVSKLSQRPHHYNTQLTAYKKQINSQINPALLPPRTRKEPQLKCKLLISIDFWENYDPAEVCQTGFGLIVTETVAQRALCFLCGSAGQEPLIFCSCCCEPYHQYCVQDEFNLKHGSLDDTLLLNESCVSVTGLSSNANTAIAKLNWLCPRCTVCYTCNMSSGAKVKCQKCQKNYHSTCLGTSKRLLGADRPLICVNCLKCRSCSTTKVTKFVGNLPMCTNCFKLRKKGNYCPVCQKCYDDQDFDLKMMECGDCHQWVHAKCETLTDEQYNLLSTLPESIEFICKRCSRKSQDAKQRACEWREAVKEEFKSSLLSVLKLLSKSRQACALLKLSPRKQMKCFCGSLNSNATSSNKYQPKSLQFSSQQEQNLGNNVQDSFVPPSSNIDIYEFDDRERDQVILNHSSLELQSKKCICQAKLNSVANHLSLVEIKQKISNGSYVSLAEFNYDMNLVIQQANCDDLVIVYKEILSEQFPWFQNETQACTDALEEDMYESAGGSYGLNTSIDSESDYHMDCLPSSQQQQDGQDRSALLAELPQDLEDQLYKIKSRSDARICLFCRRTGEGLPTEESRLLYCGHDCWVHTNCALWSAEVFEEIDGSLQNVHSAVARGRMIKCSVCGNRGATVGCNVKSCSEHYHYPCARTKNCAFLADKSMYCPQHAVSFSNTKTSFETQFEVTRPVYVELERKRKKLVEPSKVQFHIGSLEVKQLGHILPRFSDTYDALVPVNFLCSRLYWSTKEPWKIVEYTVRTYIYNASSSSLANGAVDLGKNFTVDHSQNNLALIQLGLSQIQQWHSSLSKGDYETAEEYDYLNNFAQHSSCSGNNNTQETNAANDEEPQTNADLLPPEIKDAIFEDLPGDLLEGISMLDIFTKCMNYEDMAQGEQSKDGVTNQQQSDEDTMTSIGAFTKQLTAELNSNWSNTANHNHVEDALLSTATVTAAQAVKLQKLKKSSSPVISCDVSAKNAIKRRKISENMLLSLNNHQRSQKKEVNSVTRRLDMEGANKRSFTWSAEKRYNLDCNQTDNKIKLMQVDGVDDSITEYRFVTQEATQTAVKCERCQCTYRNIESFQRHLNNCEPMSSSTSESESEQNSQTPDVAPQALTLDQLQELNNKLQQQQQQQQQQQRTTQMPFIQSIPTQTLSQLQGLQTANILQGVQLQGVQNLQNLQNLHNIQQLTQPQGLGGNFFISTATPEMNSASADLQLYANTLQGLTANLNGTFTLQPATTQYANATQLQNHPQLIAVSTNPDGTQQIIQLPSAATQQHQTAAPATYQTLQATNSDKKIVLPVTQGKPLKTMATKAAQQAAAKNKLKATTVVKPIQSKINSSAATTTNHITQPQTVNATQLLNQQLLQQLQQQAQQNNTQPQILFQTAQPQQQQQPQIIMQQPQNIISFVTTTNDGTQQPQLQYLTLPTAQQAAEFKPQSQASLFTTANTQPLLQSAYLQTDASGNLVLTNAPPQTSTPLQLLTTPQGSQVIGTLIQPQTIQLQGGNVITTTTTATAEGGIPQQGTGQAQQQQVIISGNPTAGANGLEMLTAAGGPQVILATTTQPMYYGLETIVQNTVMSSQQFVSTAMPGVLSQNASFSATTTQVFQASKIEPLVDIPAGYVLLNNVDANNAIMHSQQAATAGNTAQQQANQNNFIQAALQQQAQALVEQQQQQQQQQVQNNVFRLQTPPVASAAQSFQLHTPAQPQPQIIVTQQPQPTAPPQTPVTQTQFLEVANQQPNIHLVSAKVAPVAQVKRTKTAAPVATVTKVQPQVVNKVMPHVVQVSSQPQTQKIKLQATQVTQPAHGPNIKQINQNATSIMQQQQTSSVAISVTPQPAEAQSDVIKPQLINTTATAAPAATITTTSTAAANKKTNMIRPLHKLEVKPKVMKTATATVVTKSGHNNNVNNTNPPLVQVQATAPTNPNKVIVLKPQQQQQQQQQQLATQQQQQQSIISNAATNSLQISEEPAAIIPLTNLTEPTESSEFINLQHVTNTHQQHYNVADALLLDDSSQMAQQTLSHCSYSNTPNNYDAVQQTASSTVTHNNSDNVSNILPTIQRMPQYTNINIVNPLQQYSATNTLTTSTSTTSTTITRPTNRVLPMQQRQYEQHSQTTCSTTSSSTSTAAAGAVTQLTHTTTTNSQISQNNTTAVVDTEQQTSIKANINKIAYEAEVKQMLLHSPQPSHETTQQIAHEQLQQQQHQQQQQVMHMQQQSIQQHNLAKSSPPPLSYDIGEKSEEPAVKMCLHDLNYVHNGNVITDFVNSTTPEGCLITDPKFPAEGEIILTTECCEQEEEVLSTANIEEDEPEGEEEEEEEQQQDEEEDDGFSLKMPSADGSDNMSMDSDEPAVKEKISKILDNLTNEDCNDSLNTSTTLEAQVEMACNNQYLNANIAPENLKNSSSHNSLTANSNEQSSPLTPQEANEYYTPTTEETSAFIAAQLVAESMKEDQEQQQNYNDMIKTQSSNKLQEEVENSLNTNYIQNCTRSPQSATNLNSMQQQQQTHTVNFTAPMTMAPIQAPQPPARDPKRVIGPHLLYEIQSDDGFTYKSASIAEVWEKVFEAVQVARRAYGLSPLPEGPLADMSGVQMIGLKTNALKYLIEQLPGVEKCKKYTPKYHKRNGLITSSSSSSSSHTASTSSLSSSCSLNGNASISGSLDTDSSSIDYASDQEDLNENPYECARCEPYSKRSEYDMFSWLASRHRKQPVQVFVQPSDNELVPRRGTGSNLPMAMKYRTLKETYKDYVGVFRSHIHGRGLYCTKDIEAGEMVIEYAGELIRSTLTDQRERYYNSRGIGCYMFKIDEHLVVDATMRGNAARFINHSCEPNCYSKVVDILGHKHIIIFALRRIVQGEELTYDYKFPFEDEKIPCSCGSKRCRKYLN